MGIYGLKPAFRRSLAPLARLLRSADPDAISALAVVFALLAGVALYLAPGARWLYLVTPLLLFARIAMNALDGMVAQWRGIASARGELVNEASDRASDVLILGGWILGGEAPLLPACAALVVVLLVSYMGILPKAAGGKRLYEGPLGKADRMLLLGLACVVAFALPAQAALVMLVLAWTIVALGLATLARRTLVAWRDLGAR